MKSNIVVSDVMFENGEKIMVTFQMKQMTSFSMYVAVVFLEHSI